MLMPPIRVADLSDLAEIRLGQVFRTGIEETKHGSVRLVQTRDVKEGAEPVWENLARIEDPLPAKSAWLQAGDVLLTCRGENLCAICLTKVPGPTLCTQHLFIIRPDPVKIRPAFLAWQLNQAPAQAYFARLSEGSNQQSIRRSLLDQTPIRVPTLEAQTQIIALYESAYREISALSQLIQLRKQEMAAVAQKILNLQSTPS
ncbi:MAG: hypothetical protein RL095_272 [Verrucomicrobiota bacterium]|jgi:hypothetical protein